MMLDLARLAADAVLYEGYLLYPYRSTAAKNQVRWQFGVLGPPGAADSGLGEETGLAVDTLLRPDDDRATVTVSEGSSWPGGQRTPNCQRTWFFWAEARYG